MVLRIAAGSSFARSRIGARPLEPDAPGPLSEPRDPRWVRLVHFSAVLLGATTLSAPRHRFGSVAALLVVFGAAGIVYALVVLPLAAYVGTILAAILLPGHVGPSLFAIAGMALVLLFVGVHNAWDTVAYLAVSTRGDSELP